MSSDRQRKPGASNRPVSVQRRVADPGRRGRTDSLAPRPQDSASPAASREQAPLGDVHPDDAWLVLPSTRAALVQRRGAGAVDPATVHDAAAAGVATPVQDLPHRDDLERSLGTDLSGVRAHVGGDAEASAAAMGAEAYAAGDDVVLPANPSLHLTAHEVAHTLQQRRGVQLADGVGAAGDRHEQQADAVADAVERGDRVDTFAADGGGPSTTAVQRRESDDAHDLPAGFEPLITGTLEMTVVAGDLQAARTRVTLLRAQFRALHRKHRQALLARLEHPRKGDALAALFEYKLATAERRRLLAVLRDEEPAATEEPAQPDPGGTDAVGPGQPAAADAVLQSADPAINGMTVPEAGSFLRARAANYAEHPAQQQQYAADNLRNEKRILDDHSGILGTAINWFNDVAPPDPERWRQAIVDWGVVQTQLQAVLGMAPSPATINTMGELTEKGLRGWDRAMTQTQNYSDELIVYLEGFAQAAKSVHSGVEIAAEVAMAGAIAMAVVASGGTLLSAGAGLVKAVGATGLAAGAIKGTVALVGAGTVGAAVKGTTHAAGQFAVETGEVVYDMAARGKTFEAAADGFDWGAVATKGLDGLQTGFIDGVMAQGGLAIEAIAGKLIGKVSARFLGQYAGRIYAVVLRKATERAISAGVAGGISGGLDAGARAALAGRSLPEILSAIEKGAMLGGALGVVLGGGVGAYAEVRAARSTAPIVDDLGRAAADVPGTAAAGRDIERLAPGRFRPVEETLAGSMNKARLVDAETGKQYLFKPNDPAGPVPERAVDNGITADSIGNRAKASEQLAKQLDIDTPDVRLVEYEGQVGSLQEWRAADNRFSLQSLRDNQPDLYERVLASPEYQRLRADLDTFDYVTNNLDRNRGNLLVDLDEAGNVAGLMAIDHDLTFTRTAERFVDDLGTWAVGLPERYSPQMIEQLRRIQADPDGFRNAFRSFLSDDEINAALSRVETVLKDVDAKVAAHGEKAFWDGSDVARAQPGTSSASASEGRSAPYAAEVVPAQPVELAGETHSLRLRSTSTGDVGLWICSDCGLIRDKIQEVLRRSPAKGPGKAVRERLERLHEKVVQLERGVADRSIRHTDAAGELNQIAAHLRDISQKYPSANPLCVFGAFDARIDYGLLADQLGFEKIGGRSHGQPVFRRGNEYISPDTDSHRGGVWKKATGSVDNLRNRTTRDGTYNEDLTVRVDE